MFFERVFHLFFTHDGLRLMALVFTIIEQV
jgi:hypothetical protein